MYRQILESIDGIGIYPIVTLIMFFIFFAIVILWLLKMDKNYVKKMVELPLDERNKDRNIRGGL